MKREIVRDLRPPVGARGRCAHLVELALERADVAASLLGRLARTELFESHAHREHRQKVLVGDGTNACTAERLGLDEPQQLEVPERLAHGRLARAELAREARLDEPLARLEVSPEDALEQEVLDLLSENGA
jgi:hypothetical protein